MAAFEAFFKYFGQFAVILLFKRFCKNMVCETQSACQQIREVVIKFLWYVISLINFTLSLLSTKLFLKALSTGLLYAGTRYKVTSSQRFSIGR